MRIKLTERNILIGLLLVLGGLLCLRAFSTVFLYPMLLVAAAVFAFCPLRICLPVLCFLLPFANIIKLQVGQISLFTILFLIYVIRTLLKKGALKRLFLLGLLFFAGYSVIFSGMGKIITIATMVCGFAMLHDACQSDEYDYKEALYAFCAGIIISSTLGLFKDYLPIINSFVQVEMQKVGHEEYVERFVGLNVNPNYYTMDISVALSCLVATMGTSGIKKIHVIFFSVLSIFGLMSVSKSFLIIWAILLLILMYFGYRNGGTTFLKLLAILTVTAVFIFVFAKESIDTYIFRLTADSSGSLNEITTGRTDIWISYLKAFVAEERTMFFGAGLGSSLKRAPHNTYIEALYSMGLIGSIVWLGVLRLSVPLKNVPKNLIYYAGIVILLIRFMGIGMLTHDSFWYYFTLICLLLKEGEKTEQSKILKQSDNLAGRKYESY